MTELIKMVQYSYEAAALDGNEWDGHSSMVIQAVRKISSHLCDLKDAIIAFVQGAWKTFVKQFSKEFRDGGDIDKLTQEEQDSLFFSSTNDANKGGDSWDMVWRHKETASTDITQVQCILYIIQKQNRGLHIRKTY
jgi:hypothetical protein